MARETKAQKQERAEAGERLTRTENGYGIKPGDTLYTVLSHKSASGMQRSIKIVCISEGRIHDISHVAAKALGWRYDDRRGAVKVDGAGMDMGFHLVYALASALFRDNVAAKVAGKSPGYLLKNEWL